VDPAQATDFVDALRPYARMGFTEVHVMPPSGRPAAYIRALGEHVVPRLQDV
jgi:hypothetical protein